MERGIVRMWALFSVQQTINNTIFNGPGIIEKSIVDWLLAVDYIICSNPLCDIGYT